jgi:aminoglycoside/choline kinase family phosphotransferase/dTDP-glucose pyrophosphorylase
MGTKAIVLAAGFGTRLRPLTCAVPKPLLPVWGEPMLARVVAMLRERGVGEIAVNCHYLHGQVEAWCGANGCRAVHEPEILGTGGVLNPLRDWIDTDDFYLVNGDIVFDNPPELDLSGDGVVAAAAVTLEGPRTIEVEPASKFVTCWRSPDPGWEGTFTYCGFSLFKAEILDYVKPEGFSSIVEACEKAMMDGKFVKACAGSGFRWADAGTVESYLDVNRDGDDNAFADIPQIKAALAASGAEGKVDFIGVRGSDRVFFRAPGRVFAVYDDSKRGENAKYAAHARWLAGKGVPVPAVLADLEELKTLVLEDAGREGMKLEGYVKSAEALARFNALDFSEIENALEPPMDAGMWKWERELFREHCLEGHFGRELPADAEAELERVAAILEKEPCALVHRDFQSTNVLWRDGELKFIDFQGMRKGPAVYDLASLVYDPYVKLGERSRKAIVKVYAEASGRGDIDKVLPFAAVERLIQCLGAYGRLAGVGRTEFCRFILPALENLLAAADEAGLDAVGALAEDLIAAETSHDHKNCHCRK